jgi:hypothetical protein
MSGVFGYLAPCHWIGDFVAGPLSSMLGSIGYVAVLKYFDPLVRPPCANGTCQHDC